MHLKKITDKQQAKFIFTQGSLLSDHNKKNYTDEQFEKAWSKWLGFFILKDNNNIVCFCGIRSFGEYVRIFDRYLVFPEYRNQTLNNASYSIQMIETLLKNTNNKIPFFSIEHKLKRPALLKAIKKFNEVLKPEDHFHALPGLHETAKNSWQNIAINVKYNKIKLNIFS